MVLPWFCEFHVCCGVLVSVCCSYAGCFYGLALWARTWQDATDRWSEGSHQARFSLLFWFALRKLD